MASSNKPAQQLAVAPPEDVAETPDTQPSVEKQDPVTTLATVPATASVAPLQQAETSGLSDLMDRVLRLEKTRSDSTGNGEQKRSKKGTKAKRCEKSLQARRKRRHDDEDDPLSSSSSSSSSDSDESPKSEDDERRRRLHKSHASGFKCFRKRGPHHGDLKPLRATNPLYAELLNYR